MIIDQVDPVYFRVSLMPTIYKSNLPFFSNNPIALPLIPYIDPIPQKLKIALHLLINKYNFIEIPMVGIF